MYSKLTLLYIYMYSLFFRFFYTTSFEMTISHHGSLSTLYPLSHPHLGTQHFVSHGFFCVLYLFQGYVLPSLKTHWITAECLDQGILVDELYSKPIHLTLASIETVSWWMVRAELGTSWTAAVRSHLMVIGWDESVPLSLSSSSGDPISVDQLLWMERELQ